MQFQTVNTENKEGLDDLVRGLNSLKGKTKSLSDKGVPSDELVQAYGQKFERNVITNPMVKIGQEFPNPNGATNFGYVNDPDTGKYTNKKEPGGHMETMSILGKSGIVIKKTSKARRCLYT